MLAGTSATLDPPDFARLARPLMPKVRHAGDDVRMLTVRVTNSTNDRRVWNVEPYGDEVSLSPGDVLEVQYECALSITLEATLHPGAEVVWSSLDGDTVLPEALTLNGRSLWQGLARGGGHHTRIAGDLATRMTALKSGRCRFRRQLRGTHRQHPRDHRRPARR